MFTTRGEHIGNIYNKEKGKNQNEEEDNSNKKLSDFHSYLYPMRDIIELDSNKVEQSKRSENYANEVIKQEASVMHSNAGGPKALFLSPVASSLLLLMLSFLVVYR